MNPKSVRDSLYGKEGCEFISPDRIFKSGTIRKVHVSRPAIRQNMTNGKKHPTMVVIDEYGQKHFYHAVKADGFLGFDPEDPDANVYLYTDQQIMCFLDPKGDPPFDPFIEPASKKPKTIGDVIWEKLMSFRRKTRRGMYVGWWGFLTYTPIVNCIFDPGDLEPAAKKTAPRRDRC